MNKICFAALLFLTTLFIQSAFGASSSHPPYYVPGPVGEPRMFGEGIISTRDDEFGGAFTPDGNTCFFSMSVPRHYLYVIMTSHFDHGKWSTPEVAPFSGLYRDFDPVMSADGTKIYFASDRPVAGQPKHDYDIWVVERKGNGWGEPTNLGAPINSEDNEDFASVTKDGTIYFSSTRPGAMGGPGDSDLYRSRLLNGKYQTVEHLGKEINSEAFELDCFVTPDESMLFIGSIGRPDSLGNYDIYVSRNTNGTWSQATNLGPKVNSAARDYSPRLTPDGKFLFFTSERDFTMLPNRPRLTYAEMEKGLHSILNGSGNIYQIELSALGL